MKELLNEIDGLQDGSLMAHADGSVNKVNKETREKIEDILNSYILDDLPSGMVSELSTLIQSERKEAVKAFVEWAKLEPKIFYGHSYIQKALTDAVDDYLKERGNL